MIKDPLGIHARPAGELARIIKKFDCTFVIEAISDSGESKKAENGRVVRLMSLGAVKGTKLKCSAEGPDGAKAIKTVREYMEDNL